MVRYLLVAILAVAVTTFALQNTAPTSVRFLVWTLEDVPLAGVVLLAVGAGLAIMGAPLLFARLRHHSRVRALEARVAELQARQPSSLQPPEPPPPPPGER
jgi:putative membrane protein